MCGRYATFGPVSVSREAREVLEQLDVDLIEEIARREPRFNIAPTQRALVVRTHDERVEVEAMRWGLVPSWAKDLGIGTRMINARREGLPDKPAFRAAFQRRRCLLPASGYFEWQGDKGSKQPFFIRPADGTLMLFAGLWETWRDPDGNRLHTYTVITGEPGKVGSDIHDRQPVVLDPQAWEDWLFAPPDVAEALLTSTREPDLVYYPVSKAVGSPRNDTPDLVQPLPVA